MSKKTGKAEGKKAVKKVTKGRQVVATQPKQETLLRVKPDVKYEGARAAWYAALLAHDGNDAEQFVHACTKNPPATPKSGKAEDPRGWLRYFVRAGVASLS